MSQNNNSLDFIGSNNNSMTPKAAKLGGIDFKWVAINPSDENYASLVEQKGFRIGEVQPEYIKDTDYGRYLRLQLFIEETEPAKGDFPVRDNINFYIYAADATSMNGNLQTIDGLRNKSYIPVDAEGNLNPSDKQGQFLDMETLIKTRRGEADLLEFLLIVSGLYTRNNKVRRDNAKIMEQFPLLQLDNPDLEEPTLDTLISPSALRPDQATLDVLFDINSTSEQQAEAYAQVIGFYQELCEKINSLKTPNAVKIARGMNRADDGKVYPILYTNKFGLPGSNSGTYSTASPIVKDIKNRKDYAISSGKDFPFYFPETLEIEDWSGNEALLGGKPNTSKVAPGRNPNAPTMPNKPAGPGMRNPMIK